MCVNSVEDLYSA